MAAITDTDVSIDASGNIRWSSNNTTKHTVLEFIQWLQDKQDDGQAAGDDLLDITVATPFERSTDQILTLNSPFNIDDNLANHFYDGSISQTDPTDGEETLYSGLAVIGPVETGTEYMILQDGKILDGWWGTGVNAEASPSLVFSRHLVKSKVAGVKIDGQRITVLARELGDQYRRFPVTLGTANSVAAIGNGSDLFNTSTDATLEGYFGTITNTEGFQDLDIEATGTTYEFFSQWSRSTQSVNDVYEYTKWISQRSTITSNATVTHTGTWMTVDNATIQGFAQEFTADTNAEMLTAVKVKLRFQGTRTTITGNVYAELYADNTTIPGTLLGRSENIPVTRIQNNSAGEDYYFHFNQIDPSDGTDQRNDLTLTGGGTYWIAIRHDEGTATEYLEIDGVTTGASPDGATYNGAVWSVATGDGFNLDVYTSPVIHGIHGDRFEGLNVDINFTAETGTLPENTAATTDTVFWGTEASYDTGTGTFLRGERAQIWTTSGKTSFVTGATILYGVTGATGTLYIAQDTVSSVTNNYYIEGLDSGANALFDGVTINHNAVSGGTGIILAKDDNGATGEVYLQTISGVNPVNTAVIWDAGAPTTNNVTCGSTTNTRTLNPEFLGTSTGSNIIGATGQCFVPSDVSSSDTFFDLSNTQRTPPNNQTFTVSGVIAKEDRILVGPRSAGALNKAQHVTNVGLSATNETVVQTSSNLFPGTPASGTIRVELDSGIYRRVRYATYTGGTSTNVDYNLLGNDTFTSSDVATGTDNITLTAHNYVTLDKVRLTTSGTLPTGLSTGTDYYIINVDANTVQMATSVDTAIDGTQVNLTGAGTGTQTVNIKGDETADTNLADFSGDNATSGNDVFVSYIDTLARSTSESYSAVYTTPVDLFVRVRDGGGTPIKTFENASAQFLGTPQTVAAVRTADA